jgi:arylsulfatase A-like enzyme
MRHFLSFLALLAFAAPGVAADKPNIVVILADDLGYGDVQRFNPAGKIPTPNIDELANAGTILTDAHSPSAVCSPTRYGLMTGRYAWRSKLKSGVLGGLSPRLIEPNRLTVAQLLKDNGYHTACIGKWHLGMDWQLKPGKSVAELGVEPREQVSNVEYDKPIKNGPSSVGFDYYFGISASLDMVPYTFIENDRVVANPTEDRDFAMMFGKETGPRTRKGPAAPGFEVNDVLPTLRDKAVSYIGERAKVDKPFFLYLPLTAPHTPIAPTKDWQKKSGTDAPYMDFVMATDAVVGAVLAALKKHGFEDNTLVIFTSDNGCAPLADFPALAKLGHNPNHVFRGSKADVYEGGHRLPFIVRWPGKVKAKGESKALAVHTDIFATCADVIGAKLPDDAAEDSASLLPALGVTTGRTREGLAVHSVNGSFAIREGKWKLCLCPGSGGWSAPRPGSKDEVGLPAVQLFDLDADIGEKTNLQDKHPDVVERLTKQLETWVADGRSTPGKPQKNTTPVVIRKK